MIPSATMLPQWYVLHTKPRQEKKVAERLERLGLEIYLPLQKVVRQWSDRKKKVDDPLFKSYLFIRIPEQEREKAFLVPGVIRYLYWLGKPARVRENEIEAIRSFLNATEGLPENAFRFERGDKLTIGYGPLKGMEGTYLYQKGNQLILMVDSLGTLVRAEVNARWVA
ncbi:MAG: UpxY family transcription antiterminator [Bacteroidota bacterium]|nr:UpxY family transcription antiterminator [Bacteroidota bacterium]